MIELGRRATLGFFVAALIACDAKKKDEKKKKDDDDDDDDKPSKKKSKDKDKDKDKDSKSAAPADAKPRPEYIAFVMGRSYAFAFQQGVLDNAKGVKADMDKVLAGAELLGIAAPPVPTDDYMKKLIAIASNLKAKHGEPVQALFVTGARLVNAHFGTALKSDLKGEFNDLDLFLPKTKLPAELWQDRYAKIKAAPAAEPIKQLSEAILAHLQK